MESSAFSRDEERRAFSSCRALSFCLDLCSLDVFMSSSIVFTSSCGVRSSSLSQGEEGEGSPSLGMGPNCRVLM